MSGMDDCRALLAEWLHSARTDDLARRTRRFLDATEPGDTVPDGGVAEALAWFREDPSPRLEQLAWGDGPAVDHAVTIVRGALVRADIPGAEIVGTRSGVGRFLGMADALGQIAEMVGLPSDIDEDDAVVEGLRAALARDVPTPTGRDLTAQDVRYEIDRYGNDPAVVADHLNRIARPSARSATPGDAPAAARPAGDDTAPPDVVTAASQEMQRHHIDPDYRDADRNDRCLCGGWTSGEMAPGWDDHLAEQLGNAGLLAAADPRAGGDTAPVVAPEVVSQAHPALPLDPRWAGDTAPDDAPTAGGFTLDDQGRRVNDGWDHDGDLIATLQGDAARMWQRGERIAAAARRVAVKNGALVGIDALTEAVEAWDEGVDRDDAPTTETETETRTEWRVRVASGVSPNFGRDYQLARDWMDQWRERGEADAVIESRTVSTTTRITAWKAEQG